MPVATMPAVTEAPAEPALRDDHAAPPARPVRGSGGGDGRPDHGGGDGGGAAGRSTWPSW